jgi:hypothetical protein
MRSPGRRGHQRSRYRRAVSCAWREVTSPHGLVQHVGSWVLLGLLNKLGVYEVAERCRGDAVSMPSLRVALDATAIALAIGEKCVEGVRRIETPSAGMLLRHAGGVSASWTRGVLHAFADKSSTAFQATMASRLLAHTADGDERVVLYIDNHMRPYTDRHVIRKGWRMQAKRAVPGTTDFYLHDETVCPLWRMSTTSHDSLCAWLMPAVEFARLSLGEHVTPVLVFDRGGAFPEAMAELRDAGAEQSNVARKCPLSGAYGAVGGVRSALNFLWVRSYVSSPGAGEVDPENCEPRPTRSSTGPATSCRKSCAMGEPG